MTYRRFLYGLIALFSLIWIVIWIIKVVQNINMPQIEYSEGFMLYTARLFGYGQWNWALSQSVPPFNVSFYTPLFYYIYGGLMNIFGDTLLLGRLLVLSCFIINIALIYLIVKYFTRNNIVSLIAAGLPFLSYIIVGWSFFVRVDMMAVMFELLGLYSFIRWDRVKHGPCGMISILCFVLAIWTKQSALAAPLAVFIYLLLSKDYENATWFAGICGAFLFVSFSTAIVLTNGAFVNNVFLYLRSSPTIRPFDDIIAYSTVAFIPIIPVLIIAARQVISNYRHLLSLFVASAVVLNLAMITHPGGAQNYFFESIFACSLAAGVALDEFARQKGKLYFASFLVTVWMLVNVNQLMIYPDAGYPDRCREASEFISNSNYPVLTENAGIVIDAGKTPYYEPFVFSQLPKFGYWSESAVLTDLENRRIEYVITQRLLPYNDFRRFSPGVLEMVTANYEVALDYSQYGPYGFVIYKPKGIAN